MTTEWNRDAIAYMKMVDDAEYTPTDTDWEEYFAWVETTILKNAEPILMQVIRTAYSHSDTHSMMDSQTTAPYTL